MKNLDFLKGITLAKVQETEATTRVAKISLPTGDTIRLYKSGKIFPSVDLTKEFDLQFVEKKETPDTLTGGVSTTVVGCGLDFIGSENWTMVEKLEEPIMFLAFIPREGNTKIDLWGSTKYDKEGTPKSNVLEQGTASFAKDTLKAMVTEYYGVDWDKVNFVDLRVITEVPMISPNQVYHLPKVISRGEHKGNATYVRRENIAIFPLDIIYDEVAEVEAKEPDGEIEEAQKEELVGEFATEGFLPNNENL